MSKGDSENIIYLIMCSPKFKEDLVNDALVFRGTLDDIVYKFGVKSSNPMNGFVSKGVHFIYRFYKWTGRAWVEILDPRP